MPSNGINLSNNGSVVKLQNFLETMRPDLVIVDALVRIHANYENDAGEMASLFKIF